MAIKASSVVQSFHDSIRNTFSQAATGSTPAYSTTSVAYHMESAGNASVALYKEQTKHNSIVIKMMDEQTKLLKKLVRGEGSGSFFGGGRSWTQWILDKTGLSWLGNKLKGAFKTLGSKLTAVLGIDALLGVLGGFKTRVTSAMRDFGKTLFEGTVGVLKKAVLAPFKLVEAAGRPILKTLAGVFSSGIFSTIGSFASKLGGGKLLSIAGKALRFGKAIPLIGGFLDVAFAAVDSVSGWKNADKLLGKSKNALTFGDKLSSAVGSLVDGLGFGVPNMIVKYFGGSNLQTILANGVAGATDKIYDMAKSMFTFGIDVLGKATNLIAHVKDYMPTPQQVLDTLKGLPDKAMQAFDTLKDTLFGGLTSIVSWVSDKVTGVFKNIGTSLDNWWGNKGGSSQGSISGGSSPPNKITGPETFPSLISTQSGSIPSQDFGIQPNDGNIPSVAPSPTRASTNSDILGAPASTGSSGKPYNPATVSSGNAGNLSGSGATPNAKSWYNFFTKPLDQGGMGYTGAQAKGMIAVMQGESGKKLNPSLSGWDVNGPSGGTIQWHDNLKNGDHRFTDLKKFAASQGKDWTDIGVQQQNYRRESLTTHKAFDAAIRRATTAEQAVAVGVSKMEIPRDIPGQIALRTKNLNALQGIDDQSKSIANTSPSNPATPSATAPGTSQAPNPQVSNTTNSKTVGVSQNYGRVFNTNMGDTTTSDYSSIINGPQSFSQITGNGATPTGQVPLLNSGRISGAQATLSSDASSAASSIPSIAKPDISIDQSTSGVTAGSKKAMVSAAANGVSDGAFSVADVPMLDENKMLIVNGHAMT